MSALQLVDLSDFGGEPRLLDLRVAERLGFDRPRRIRQLIERHKPELERYGSLPHVGANSGPLGGRPSVEFYLNEAQAVLVCMKSETALAADVRQEVIQVFLAWRHGKLAPASPVTTEVLDSRLQPINDRIAYLAQSHEETKATAEETRAAVARVNDNVVFLSKRIDDFVPRRDFEAWKGRQFDEVCLNAFGGYCPTCPASNRTRLVADDGTRILGVAEDEHFRGRSLNGVEDGWVTCGKCNLRLHNDRQFHDEMQPRFAVFQQYRRELFGPSTTAPRSSRSKSGFNRYDPRQGSLLA